MCDAATHDAVHDTVHDAPSLEYRYPTLRNGGFIAQEYSMSSWPNFRLTNTLGAYKEKKHLFQMLLLQINWFILLLGQRIDFFL